MNPENSPTHDLAKILVQLEAQQAELSRLKYLEEEVLSLRNELKPQRDRRILKRNGNAPETVVAPDTGSFPEPTDRRGMLRKVGALAAGVAAAGLLRPSSSSGASSRNFAPAAPSEDGDPFIVGQVNFATSSSWLFRQVALIPTVLNVQNYGDHVTPNPFEKVAIYGVINSTGSTTPNAGIAAIRGDAIRPAGTGFAIGVIGEGTDLGGIFKGTAAAVRLFVGNTAVSDPNQNAPANAGIGDLYRGSANGSLWYKTSASGPASYRRLADATTAGQLTILPTPVRYIDTRNGTGGAGGAFQNGTVRQYNFVSLQSGTIPFSARGIVGNLTAATPTGNGNFQTNTVNSFPAGSAAVMSFRTGVNLSNHFLSALDASGNMFVRANFASVHLVLDVQGYYL